MSESSSAASLRLKGNGKQHTESLLPPAVNLLAQYDCVLIFSTLSVLVSPSSLLRVSLLLFLPSAVKV